MAELSTIVQAVVWPGLIAVICWWLRSDIERALRAFVDRVEQGDSLEAGTSGLKLARSPAQGQAIQLAPGAAADAAQALVPHSIYLVHAARRDAKLDKNDREYYRIRIWVDADDPALLSQVESVTYHLHPDFANPVRKVKAPESNFSLATAAWGQFLVFAEVGFKGGGTSVRLERYISF